MLLLCCVLAACAKRGGDTQTVSFWAQGKEAEVVGALVKDFEREHADIHIDVQQIPATAAHEKLLTAYAANHLPDVCQLGNTWLAEFSTLHALTPLQSLVDESDVVKPADYFAGIWDTNVIDGQLVGVPWYVDTRLLFYRKDILRDAGVKLPIRTWSEWNDAMAKVKAHVGPRRYAILLPLNEFDQLLSLGLQGDAPLLKDDDTRANFDSIDFRAALAFYENIFRQGWAPPMSETQVSNVWDEFFNGYYAFYFSGPWNVREFRNRAPKNLADQWGTLPLPGPHGYGAGIAGGASLVVFSTSRHKQAAWQFVEYLSRPDVELKFHALLGDLPPRRSAWSAPQLQGDEYARAFGEQLERVKPTPKVLEWERIAQQMRYVSERVVRGGESQDDAVRELDADVDGMLEKRRWLVERGKAGRADAP